MHLASLLLQVNSDGTPNAGFLAALAGVYLVIMLIGLVAVIIPFWFICKKAGFSPWLALLNIIPLGSLVLLYVLAFAEWKRPEPPFITPLP